MLKNKFEQCFAQLKDYLPTAQAREIVQKILQECDVLTQTELQKQEAQIQILRERVQQLETRLNVFTQQKQK